MKTQINLKENPTWNFINRMLYAFQVVVIAIAIPLLSYMEMTHIDKPEIPSTKNTIKTTEKSDVVILSLNK